MDASRSDRLGIAQSSSICAQLNTPQKTEIPNGKRNNDNNTLATSFVSIYSVLSCWYDAHCSMTLNFFGVLLHVQFFHQRSLLNDAEAGSNNSNGNTEWERKREREIEVTNISSGIGKIDERTRKQRIKPITFECTSCVSVCRKTHHNICNVEYVYRWTQRST